IWVGDDLAIHLEGAERLDAFDDSDQTYDSDAEVRSRFALPVSSTRNLEASRFEWMTKWTRGGYGAGVAALAVMALIAFGSLMQVSPRRNGGNLLQFVPSQTAPANSIATTVEPSNGGMSRTEPAAEPAALPESPAATAMIATRHVVQPAKTEQKVREALASQGYSDLGVSVSRSGDVFLAGEVYSKDEVHYIVRVAHHASPAASVHFPHPDIQTASGPAYLGVDNASAVESGVKVNQIVIGSPAYKAGIRPGDIITALNGKRIYYQSVLESLLAKLRPGDRVGVELTRDGSDESLRVRLAEYQQVASR
ncbi:MAG TPA: PDZ domain-containing protein, partial [Candidatus Binatus sp.]|nr:PDZ domain-containing protein [Candidatus Binatus sp.]